MWLEDVYKRQIQDGDEEDDLIDDYDLPAHWLMMQMNNFCVGANYVFLNGKHYYTAVSYTHLDVYKRQSGN